MKLKYLKELDGVRAIAALMVMVFHFFQPIETSNKILLLLKKVSILGQTGVSLFFVLSGFLITRILLSTKDNKNYFYNFYIKRSLRIFPLYYAFLIIYYYIFPIIAKSNFIDFNQQIYYWVYLQDFAQTFKWKNLFGPGHFWSLAVEEHFYLFWPLLIYFFNKKKIFISIIVLIVVSILVRIVLTYNGYEVFYFTFSRMDELAVGALLAILELNKRLINKNSYKFIILLFIVLLPTLAIFILNNASGNSSLQIIKFILLSFAYFSLIGFVITSNDNNIIKRILKLKAFSYTGKISYGLYVYHPICFWMFNHFFSTNHFLINLLGSFILTFIIASTSYYFFESYFLKLKHYFE